MGTGQSGRLRWGAIVLATMLLLPAEVLASSTVVSDPVDRSEIPTTAPTAFIAEKRAVSESLQARRALPASMVLPTRARQQTTDYNCGPAVAQVIINYTHGILSTNNAGDDRTTNWTTQATLSRWMNTSVLYGTGGAAVTEGLNHAGGLRKPFPAWAYDYDQTGSRKDLHDKIVTDIAIYEMPLAIAINPHMAKAGIYQLASWPDERPLARHWIAVRGYEGLWGSPFPIVHYSDSSAGYGGGTGNYWDLSLVIHETNDRNYGRIIW